MNFRENAKRGTISTVIGIFIVVAALASIFVEDVTWTEALAGITLGLSLIGFVKR